MTFAFIEVGEPTYEVCQQNAQESLAECHQEFKSCQGAGSNRYKMWWWNAETNK